MSYSFKKDFLIKPRYILKNARVCVNNSGYHYIDKLDPEVDISDSFDLSSLNDEANSYIEKQLQSNPYRPKSQINLLTKWMGSIRNKKILDIGCGGGAFLTRALKIDAITKGIELSDSRGAYCVNKGLDVVKRPIDSSYWLEYKNYFDCVSLWDVIEHVNDPELVLKSSYEVLESGGYIFIDTPCRDSFYHRFGVLTYKLTRGRLPTFLNIMYSSHQFGHKQIFSSKEMKILLTKIGFKSVHIIKFHELTFPYEFYLKKMFNNKIIIKILSKSLKIFFLVANIKNKIYVIAKK